MINANLVSFEFCSWVLTHIYTYSALGVTKYQFLNQWWSRSCDLLRRICETTTGSPATTMLRNERVFFFFLPGPSQTKHPFCPPSVSTIIHPINGCNCYISCAFITRAALSLESRESMLKNLSLVLLCVANGLTPPSLGTRLHCFMLHPIKKNV